MTAENKILPIVGYGSNILRETCVPAENNPETIFLAGNLVKTMNSIGTAVGLAAPQVNSNLRMFAMNLFGKTVVMINPVIKKASGSKPSPEGCLSVPKLNATVPERSEALKVEYYDEKFNKHQMRLVGFTAIIFQHELDHLNGVLFTDRLTKEGREQVQDKLSQIEKGIYESDYKMIFPQLEKAQFLIKKICIFKQKS